MHLFVSGATCSWRLPGQDKCCGENYTGEDGRFVVGGVFFGRGGGQVGGEKVNNF